MARETRSDARLASEGPRPTMKGDFLPPRPRGRAALLHRDQEVSPTDSTLSNAFCALEKNEFDFFGKIWYALQISLNRFYFMEITAWANFSTLFLALKMPPVEASSGRLSSSLQLVFSTTFIKSCG